MTPSWSVRPIFADDDPTPLAIFDVQAWSVGEALAEASRLVPNALGFEVERDLLLLDLQARTAASIIPGDGCEYFLMLWAKGRPVRQWRAMPDPETARS